VGGTDGKVGRGAQIVNRASLANRVNCGLALARRYVEPQDGIPDLQKQERRNNNDAS